MLLLTGGTGKTGSHVAQKLVETGHPVRIASRSGKGREGAPGVRLDWLDDSGHEAALQGVSGVYLVAPDGSAASLVAMASFIARAIQSGVRRLVLLSSSAIEEGGPAMGGLHRQLRETAPEWAVLRPSWFMQNFSEPPFADILRDEGRLYSATGEGRIPFVHAGDIAEVACRALTDETPHNTDHLITGPQALTYGEAAAIIGRALGRPVQHVNISEAEVAARWIALGMEESYAQLLAGLDTAIAHGAEDRTADTVLRLTGHAPKSLATFASESVATWQNSA